ncbi:MAG: radical SAM protein [Candidatus Korarchaeota archaeon]|nr:radical SAM protein [Candidatus Korarchaeota archaeon]
MGPEPAGATVRPTFAKSALIRSKIEGIDYAVNPYYGCLHGCRYCYAAWMTRRRFPDHVWGLHVHPKVNVHRLLDRELSSARPGLLGIGTSTDPYQSIESRFQLTRRCLEVISHHPGFDVSLLTKSPLVLRDLEVLRAIDAEVGFSVSGLGDAVRLLEPRAPPGEARLAALRRLSSEGLRTFAFISPVLPGVTDRQIRTLLRAVAEARPSKVLVDALRFRPGVLQSMRSALSSSPDLLRELGSYASDQAWWLQRARAEMEEAAAGLGLSLEFLF